MGFEWYDVLTEKETHFMLYLLQLGLLKAIQINYCIDILQIQKTIIPICNLPISSQLKSNLSSSEGPLYGDIIVHSLKCVRHGRD